MVEAPPGGESLAAFQARVDAAWAELQRRAAALDGPLAVVTHGLVIHELLSRHVTWPVQGANGAPPAQRPARLRNTSVSVLDARPPHAVHLADCIAHLDEALRAPGDALTGG
jgi:broad specificity phosphatase PhoE